LLTIAVIPQEVFLKESTIQDTSLSGEERDLEYIFHPRSVALVGVTSDPANLWGQGFLKGLLDFGYSGQIYPINPKASQILGLKVYPSLSDVPGPVDYVISMIPAPLTPQLIEDCGAKGVKVVHLFTAGFGETGEEVGKRLEAELLAIARRVGVRLIGPNCMGIHYAKSKITFDMAIPEEAKESGNISFLSQSGAFAIGLVHMGSFRGLRFNKIASYGNAIDLNEADFLELFATDADTEIIAAYIEGIKDGPRFRRALIEAAAVKPVIVLKGGRTSAGTGAVSSHTGALAGNEEIWDILLKQAGAIRVHSMDELSDLLVAFCHLPPLAGRNVGVIGTGGGASVEAADLCESAGLFVPALPPEIRNQLREFTPVAGTSVRNPVDTISMFIPQELSRTIELVASHAEIDFVIFQMELGMDFLQDIGRVIVETGREVLIETAKKMDKPIVVVPRYGGRPQGISLLAETQERYVEAGLPVFPSIERAALAISRFISYHEARNSD
jgi:acyl-CoA synthetase (NDP forming)